MTSADEYYGFPPKPEGPELYEDVGYILYRPHTNQIFKFTLENRADFGHEIADGLEAWTKPVVINFDLLLDLKISNLT